MGEWVANFNCVRHVVVTGTVVACEATWCGFLAPIRLRAGGVTLGTHFPCPPLVIEARAFP